MNFCQKKTPRPNQTKHCKPLEIFIAKKKRWNSCLLFVSAFLTFHLTNSKTVPPRKLWGKHKHFPWQDLFIHIFIQENRTGPVTYPHQKTADNGGWGRPHCPGFSLRSTANLKLYMWGPTWRKTIPVILLLKRCSQQEDWLHQTVMQNAKSLRDISCSPNTSVV